MKKEISKVGEGISFEEIDQILKHAKIIKHRILIEMIYECRLSIDDVLSLKYSDIDLINGELVIKGARIILPLRLVKLLRYYFSCEKNSKYLLETHHGRLSKNAAERIIETISLQAINKPINSADLIKSSPSQHDLLLNQEDCPSIYFDSRMGNLPLVK